MNIISTANGAFYATSANGAAQFGTLPVAQGGTGNTTNTTNAVLTGNGTSAVKNVLTANGAFYATSANGAATFGTLPIAQGGTGGTSASTARSNLGLGGAATYGATTSVTSGSSNLVTSGGVYTALGNYGKVIQWATITLSANGWNSSTKIYSLTSSYPNASYDILDIVPYDSTTDAMLEAWIAANCGGYQSTNQIKARGTVPTIALNMMICYVAK